MKKLLFLLAITVSLNAFAQPDTVKKQATLVKNTKQDSVTKIQHKQPYPPLSQIYVTNNLSQKQLNDYTGNYLSLYSNQARIGMLMEGGGVVLGFGGALLSANSVSATPINACLIGGGIITLVGFLVHYDSYKFLKHASQLLKSKQ